MGVCRGDVHYHVFMFSNVDPEVLECDELDYEKDVGSDGVVDVEILLNSRQSVFGGDGIMGSKHTYLVPALHSIII